MKKALFITISILVIALVGFLSYWLIFGRNSNDADPNNQFPTGKPSTQFPDTSSGSGGGFGDTNGSIPSDSGGVIGTSDGYVAPILRKLSDNPAAGTIVFTKASSTRVRFVDRATGHVYEATDSDPSINRISNTTIPKVMEALWLPDGSGYFARYLRNGSDTVETYAARINETSKSVSGSFLPANLEGATVGPNGNLAALLLGSGSTALNIYSITGERVRTAFSSPFSEWLPAWSGASTVFLYSKPSYLTRGESMRITLSSGAVAPSVRAVSGLSLLPSPNASRVLYSSGSETSNRLFAYDFSKSQATQIPLSTIANDKCVWSRTAATNVYCAVPASMPFSLPDVWYRGEISFNDSLWKINAATGEAKVIASLELQGEMIDVTGLTVSGNDKAFSFINKKDLTPWMLLLR